MEKVDFLIVGADFAGTMLSERISSQLGKTCLVVERRVDSKKKLRNWAVQGKMINDAAASSEHRPAEVEILRPEFLMLLQNRSSETNATDNLSETSGH